MERFGITSDKAFRKLKESSQETNLELIKVASWLTGSTTAARKS
jgi:hypothetical protein